MNFDLTAFYRHCRFASSYVAEDTTDDFPLLHSTTEDFLWTPQPDDSNPWCIFNFYQEIEFSDISLEVDYTSLDSVKVYTSSDGYNWLNVFDITEIDSEMSLERTFFGIYVKLEFINVQDFSVLSLALKGDFDVEIPENLMFQVKEKFFSEYDEEYRNNQVQFFTQIFNQMQGNGIVKSELFNENTFKDLEFTLSNAGGNILITENTSEILLDYEEDIRYIVEVNGTIYNSLNTFPTFSEPFQTSNTIRITLRMRYFSLDFYITG